MAGGTGTIDNYPKDLCRWALSCMYSSECLTKKLDGCRYSQDRELCFVYLLAKKIERDLPRVYEEWKKTVERQEEDGRKHGINAIIVYGLAKIYELRRFVIIPAVGYDLAEKITRMELPELLADLEAFVDYDLDSLMCEISAENQLAVLKIFKMFLDGTRQPAVL